MSTRAANGLVARFRKELSASGTGLCAGPSKFEPLLARELLESMLLARHLDVAALELRTRGAGHYTIGSSGHESNVVLGRLTRVSDPSLVHYRSAAFQLERARQAAGDGVRDIALSLVASSEEPVSGGRHKLFGGKALGIIPQTSTMPRICPRAVGWRTRSAGRGRRARARQRLRGLAASATRASTTAPRSARSTPRAG